MLLIDAIGVLVTMDEARGGIGALSDAAVLIEGEKIFWCGPKNELPAKDIHKKIDAHGHMVMPGLVDCHSHLIFAGLRADEFSRRMNNEDYQTIMKKGGGIMSTVKAVRQASDEDLFRLATMRANTMLSLGVTTLEAKSGYGLSIKDELRTLRLLKKLNNTHPLDIHPTFLGAHVIPEEYKTDRKKYVAEIIDDMLPQIATENLAIDCDVFCETGAYSLEESVAILSRAHDLGLGLRAHVQQLGPSGGVALVKQLPIKSLSHGEFLSKNDIALIKDTETVVEVLPIASLFLRSKNLTPVRDLFNQGIRLAIATDFNPGSAMCNDLVLAARLAITYCHFSIDEAVLAITKNAAISLGRHDIGVIKAGNLADLLVTRCKNIDEFFYDWTKHPARLTIKRGKDLFFKP